MISGQIGRQCDRRLLLTSLTKYVELYSSLEDHLTNTVLDFSWVFLQAHRQREEFESGKIARACIGGFCGGSLGAIIGATCASFTTVIATLAALDCEDLNVVPASVGFFGGALGGVLGATCAGLLGGAVGVVAESTGISAGENVFNLLGYIFGITTGAWIGHLFGGDIGTVGGAIGGGLGGCYGVRLTRFFIKVFNTICQVQNLQLQRKADSVMQTCQEITSPLIAQLSIINRISSKMGTRLGAGLGCVATQSSKCLIAVSRMSKVLRDVQKTPQTPSYLRAAEHCLYMYRELEKMKLEAVELLAFWSSTV